MYTLTATEHPFQDSTQVAAMIVDPSHDGHQRAMQVAMARGTQVAKLHRTKNATATVRGLIVDCS